MGCLEAIVTGAAAAGGAALLGATAPVVAGVGLIGYALGYGCKYNSK